MVLLFLLSAFGMWGGCEWMVHGGDARERQKAAKGESASTKKAGRKMSFECLDDSRDIC
jgi:hypothetical protein